VNALRPLDLPRPLAVETDACGDPVLVVRRGRRLRVAALLDRWRIDDEWWRTPIARLYHALALADGRTLIVFHDLIGGGWYEQRYGLRHLTPGPVPTEPTGLSPFEGRGALAWSVG
jgi:hypothetical protein